MCLGHILRFIFPMNNFIALFVFMIFTGSFMDGLFSKVFRLTLANIVCIFWIFSFSSRHFIFIWTCWDYSFQNWFFFFVYKNRDNLCWLLQESEKVVCLPVCMCKVLDLTGVSLFFLVLQWPVKWLPASLGLSFPVVTANLDHCIIFI